MNDELGKRMKDFYESRAQNSLTRRTPVIIRIDGKSFHTFCKRFEKPYDPFLNESLNIVAQRLCENIQGAKFAERHSDEISILVTDYDALTTDAFFDYNVQKICSIVASMATAEFCRILSNSKYLGFKEKWPTFDCRCFNIPEDEIENYFWWRMLDAKRGSINMWAQSNFSHAELQGLNCDQMQEKLWQEKNINWGTLPQGQKIGFIVKKESHFQAITVGPNSGGYADRNFWMIHGSPSTRSMLYEIMSAIKLVKTVE